MEQVFGVCNRVQARLDINRSMTVKYVGESQLISIILKNGFDQKAVNKNKIPIIFGKKTYQETRPSNKGS